MNMSTVEPVVIHIAGVCKGNPGPGGWGVVISREGRSKQLHGGAFYTTSHEMELTAITNALEALKKPLLVRLQTNSTYIVEGMTQWLPGWEANGWRKASGAAVSNAELWRRIVELAAPHSIEWVWVRSHPGDAGSDRANQLANLGVRQPSH